RLSRSEPQLAQLPFADSPGNLPKQPRVTGPRPAVLAGPVAADPAPRPVSHASGDPLKLAQRGPFRHSKRITERHHVITAYVAKNTRRAHGDHQSGVAPVWGAIHGGAEQVVVGGQLHPAGIGLQEEA